MMNEKVRRENSWKKAFAVNASYAPHQIGFIHLSSNVSSRCKDVPESEHEQNPRTGDYRQHHANGRQVFCCQIFHWWHFLGFIVYLYSIRCVILARSRLTRCCTGVAVFVFFDTFPISHLEILEGYEWQSEKVGHVLVLKLESYHLRTWRFSTVTNFERIGGNNVHILWIQAGLGGSNRRSFRK